MNKELIDETFYVNETRYGIWHSFDKEDNPLVTSLTEDECIKMTRFILKLRQEELLDKVGTTYSGEVTGKL